MYLRTYIVVFLACVALLGVAQSSDIADAFSFEYDFEDSEGRNAKCETVEVQDALDRLQSGYLEQVAQGAAQQLEDMFKQYATQLAACAVQGTQVSVGPFSFTIPEVYDCSVSVGGNIGNELKTQYLNKLKQDFTANCSARSSLVGAVSDARKILAENGRDGGPAFIEDYQAFMAQSRNRGRKLALNQMANTDFCPWLQAPLQGMFGFSAADAVNPANAQRDGGPTYMDTAACNAPNGYNPFDPKWQTAEGYAILMQPQNNIWGAYLMAEENISQQIADAEKQDEYEFVNTGGVGALRIQDANTGTSCRQYTADGSTCLEYGSIKQPAAGVQAEINAQRQAQYDWITNPRPEDITDPVAHLITTLMDATMDGIEPEYGLSSMTQQIADDPGSTVVTPRPTPISSGPICSYAALDCQCLDQDPRAQVIAQTAVQQAVLAAIQQQIGYSVSPDGNSVLPGQERVFLDAVCHSGPYAGAGCRINGASLSEIVIGAGYEFVVRVLNGSVILKPGTVVAACPTGTL